MPPSVPFPLFPSAVVMLMLMVVFREFLERQRGEETLTHFLGHVQYSLVPLLFQLMPELFQFSHTWSELEAFYAEKCALENQTAA